MMKDDHPDGNEDYDVERPAHRANPLTPPSPGMPFHVNDDTRKFCLSLLEN
jgi:hypothetical protein